MADADEELPKDKTTSGSNTGHASENPPDQPENKSKLKIIWESTLFPRLLIISLYQFSVYLNKIYNDSDAVATYYKQKHINFCIVSVASLVLPVCMYAIFLVTSYLAKRESTELEELGTKTVNGLLLIPWQIKRHLDKLYFVAQRVCFCRNVNERSEDKETIALLDRQAFVLEFFEDFFAGLLQILLQTYIFITSFHYDHKIQPLLGVFIGSVFSVLQLIMAFRRRDDGILTGFLSIVGWILIAISRAVALSLVASIIHFWIILLVLGHAFCISVWVTSIAMRSYQENSSQTPPAITKRKGISLFILVFVLFGLPSLTYWPFLFELKERKRPHIYLLVVFLENAAMFCFWYFSKQSITWDWMNTFLISLLFCSCIVGILFQFLYLCIKPKLTDVIVLYNMKKLNENSYGIYFDFFEVVFNLPCTDTVGDELAEAKNMLCQ